MEGHQKLYRNPFKGTVDLKGTVVNRLCPFLNGESLDEIPLQSL